MSPLTFDLFSMGLVNIHASYGLEAWAPRNSKYRITFITDPSWCEGHWRSRYPKLYNWLNGRGPQKDRWYYYWEPDETLFIKAYKEPL